MSIITHWEIYGICSKNTLMFMCTTETAAPASRWSSFKVIQLAVFIACFPASTLYPNVQSLRCNFLKMKVNLCIILQRGRRLAMWSGVVYSTFDGALIRRRLTHGVTRWWLRVAQCYRIPFKKVSVKKKISQRKQLTAISALVGD